tara:strand:+ start:4472 stop:4693 length:222 start_codon:yes stop_codon:yes gene_type:complete
MDELKQQVERLEWRVDLHEEQLTTLKDNATELKTQLDAINRSLLQIKWFVVGGGLVFFADTMGLTALVKMVGI